MLFVTAKFGQIRDFWKRKLDSRSLLYFGVTFLVLFFLCAVPLMTGLYSDCKKDITVVPTDLKAVSVNNQIITQEIYLQGSLQGLSVFFLVTNPSKSQDTVTLKLVQGDIFTQEQVKLSQLVSGSFYQFKGDFSHFKKGSATLSVVAHSTGKTEVSSAVSGTLISGLPAAKNGNNNLSGPLEIKYSIFMINRYFVYDTVLFILLLLVLILTSWLLTFKKEILEKRNYLFGCSFAIIFLSVSLNNPTASFFGQPISEAAYEFWYKAHEYGFFQSMMIMMSGEALAWTERIFIFIADKISFSRAYVFVVAQIMELTFISAVTSMACLKSFRRYFSDEIRLVFCIFMGSMVFFPYAYYFFGVSYWSAFFFIAFGLLNLNALKRWQYIAGVLVTVILCVSRIYHVVLIPICLFLLIVMGKKRGRRFQLLNVIAILASTFEGFYTVFAGGKDMANANFLQNVITMGIPRLISNTVYYQVQVLNSLFTHQANPNGLIANMIWMLFLVALLIFAVYKLFSPKHDSTGPAVLISLGMFSLGTIAMDVITSGNWASISFPISYSVPVNWTANYYQQADFHFSYAYISTAFLLMTLIYFIKNFAMTRIKTFLISEKTSQALLVFEKVGILSFSVIVVILGSEVAQIKFSAIMPPTEWQSVYRVTYKDAYYIPINVDYPVATISLTHNSYPMMFGYLANGKWGRWQDGDPAYSFNTVYTHAILGDTSDIETKGLLSISARKSITNFKTIYIAILYDRAGSELDRIPQSNSSDRTWIDFMLDKPLGKVYSVAFQMSTGEPAYVENALQVGVSTLPLK